MLAPLVSPPPSNQTPERRMRSSSVSAWSSRRRSVLPSVSIRTSARSPRARAMRARSSPRFLSMSRLQSPAHPGANPPTNTPPSRVIGTVSDYPGGQSRRGPTTIETRSHKWRNSRLSPHLRPAHHPSSRGTRMQPSSLGPLLLLAPIALACPGTPHAHVHAPGDGAVLPAGMNAGEIQIAEEPYLLGTVQLTSESMFSRAGEAYFSPDNKWIIFPGGPRRGRDRRRPGLRDVRRGPHLRRRRPSERHRGAHPHVRRRLCEHLRLVPPHAPRRRALRLHHHDADLGRHSDLPARRLALLLGVPA